jgi:hypothetical protein
MKTGILYLIESKNPPVFQTPLRIMYRRGPKLGESFLFASRPFQQCNLSEAKRLTRFKGFTIIKTRNSTYVLHAVTSFPEVKV